MDSLVKCRERGFRKKRSCVWRQAEARVNKIIGILVFLGFLYGALLLSHPAARTYTNHFNVSQRIGLYGILTLAAGVVIVTGNIDLSMGSVVGVCATVASLMLMSEV